MADRGEWELPSFHDLVDRFSLFGTAASACDTQIGANGSLFCNCKGCMRWRDYIEGRDPCDDEIKYELFTREHITGLAHYLRARAAEYELSPMDVLEVGAGSGRLSSHLNRALSQFFTDNQGSVVTVRATDSGARGLNGPLVEKEDAVHAISTGKPHVVISSWMPRGIDWTSHMRAADSVCEYILIGEVDYGICGCPWRTWGFSPAWDSSDSDQSDIDDCDHSDVQREVQAPDLIHHSEETKGSEFLGEVPPEKRRVIGVAEEPPGIVRTEAPVSATSVRDRETLPTIVLNMTSCEGVAEAIDLALTGKKLRRRPQYEVDGWKRVELQSLSKLQVCRTDERWSTTRHSHTFSFRRVSKCGN